ncbi:phage integrase family protein [Halopolyspora algeriensis]|uniref:Phage integrase family protein n=1 Tax=Halopolyspora algeriensis TaxID=1500506 RepID=A0A368VXB5_9ACTN|nr:tyrosine-type recombinase/integrase [Halopolyspora algeriensis]RCW46846.1 phage integrase family protein [Halopolyspora algeriensis]TQM47937.1 phage integrase family protein [Halopolyspora algeriensis]
MTETTYDVRIWKMQTRKNTKGKVTSYRVRWEVSAQDCHKSFKNSAQAESFRSELLSAARKGEAFIIETGLPVSMTRSTEDMSWFKFACEYMDMKWRDASPGHRKNTVDSLAPISAAMLTTNRGAPEPKVLNKAFRRAFNPVTRDSEHPPEIRHALKWIAAHSRSVGDLSKPDVLRSVLAALDVNLNGYRAAPDTVRLRRTTLTNAIHYAIERKFLIGNPLNEVKIRRNSTNLRQVDRRSVANPVQARTLLQAVANRTPHLTAFFGLMYFAALRPEEATNLRKRNLSLPQNGWGELHLERSTPEISGEWTDSRTASEERSLKHRDDDIGRIVPCPPELTAHLHNHLAIYGTAPDGRLFLGKRNGGRLGSSVYGRAWANARADAFTDEVAASPLAKRPYDLRHAAVSTWLNAGVEPTRVAEWAGHSVHVLLRVYAKCLDGGEQEARSRIDRALR